MKIGIRRIGRQSLPERSHCLFISPTLDHGETQHEVSFCRFRVQGNDPVKMGQRLLSTLETIEQVTQMQMGVAETLIVADNALVFGNGFLVLLQFLV